MKHSVHRIVGDKRNREKGLMARNRDEKGRPEKENVNGCNHYIWQDVGTTWKGPETDPIKISTLRFLW